MEFRLGRLLPLLGVGLLFYLLYLVRAALFPFLLGGLLALLLNPLVERLRQRGLSRSWAIIVIFLWLLIILMALAIYFFPLVVAELEDLAEALPRYTARLQGFIDYMGVEYRRIVLPPMLRQLADEALERGEELAVNIIEQSTSFLLGFLSRLMLLVLSPVVAFYLLKDQRGISKALLQLFPEEVRKQRLLPFYQEVISLLCGF